METHYQIFVGLTQREARLSLDSRGKALEVMFSTKASSVVFSALQGKCIPVFLPILIDGIPWLALPSMDCDLMPQSVRYLVCSDGTVFIVDEADPGLQQLKVLRAFLVVCS